MFKLMVMLTERQTMSDDDFARHVLEEHASLAKKMPGLRKYVVNIVQRPPNKETDYHGVPERWFDDRESMKKAFSSPQGGLAQKDTDNFSSKTMTLFIDEHEIK